MNDMSLVCPAGITRARGLTALALALALLGFATGSARAERVPMSPTELTNKATHIVVGKVLAIYQKANRASKGFKDTDFVAEVQVLASEKGDLATNQLAYVRYWRRSWVGIGQPPPNTAGYQDVPKEGEVLRVFLVRNGYNGFGNTTDGGLTVLGPNGFNRENLPAAPPAK